MFCVLIIQHREKSFFEFLFGRFKRDTYDLKTVPVFKGAPFYVLTVTVGEKGADWDYIVQSVGKCAKRLVTANHITVPECEGLGVFKSEMLYNKMTENTFLHIIKNNYSRKKPFDICFIDKNAKHTDFLVKVSPYAFRITVATDKKEEYSDTCDEIIESTGLCPSVQSAAAEAEVKICLDRRIMTVNTTRGFLNIGNGGDFTVPDIYSSLIPPKTDKYSFYAALYELCGAFDLGNCVFDVVEVNREKMSVDNVHFT